MVLELNDVDVKCGDGWIGIVERMLDELNAAGLRVHGLVADEDQGRLRVDYNTPTSTTRDQSRAIMRIMLLAQCRSVYTCETCARPGEHRTNSVGWRSTRCLEHTAPDKNGSRLIYDERRRPWREVPDGVVEYDPVTDQLIPKS
jgi:hypothetical protein